MRSSKDKNLNIHLLILDAPNVQHLLSNLFFAPCPLFATLECCVLKEKNLKKKTLDESLQYPCSRGKRLRISFVSAVKVMLSLVPIRTSEPIVKLIKRINQV